VAVAGAAALVGAVQRPEPRPAAPGPCAAAEYRQFDFWVGVWDVKLAGGRLAGSNKVERVEGGCALQETWTSATGNNGRSLTMYSKDDGQWHQTWVDNGGTLLMIAGGMRGPAMVMEGETRGADGKPVRNRITWTPIEPSGLRQLWEASTDGGRTWTASFDGTYVRK
jgi:hypothetical protein